MPGAKTGVVSSVGAMAVVEPEYDYYRYLRLAAPVEYYYYGFVLCFHPKLGADMFTDAVVCNPEVVANEYTCYETCYGTQLNKKNTI